MNFFKRPSAAVGTYFHKQQQEVPLKMKCSTKNVDKSVQLFYGEVDMACIILILQLFAYLELNRFNGKSEEEITSILWSVNL